MKHLHRLELAAQDMTDVSAAAEFLAEARKNLAPPLRRALEAGVVVVYARPFTDGKVGRLGRNYAPKDPYFKTLHKRLLELRNRLQAHTDITTVRFIAEEMDVSSIAEADLGYYPYLHHGVERLAAEIRVQTLTSLEIRALSGLGTLQSVQLANEAHRLRKRLGLNPKLPGPLEFDDEESLRRALGGISDVDAQ